MRFEVTVTIEDPALAVVESALRTADPNGIRVARTLRRTYDQIYDGRNTGRYAWAQLRKTEKTHYGSLIEINLQREFKIEFADGINFDYQMRDSAVANGMADFRGVECQVKDESALQRGLMSFLKE